jgi:hypothetical protein
LGRSYSVENGLSKQPPRSSSGIGTRDGYFGRPARDREIPALSAIPVVRFAI